MNLDALDLKARPGAFSTFDMEIVVPELEKLRPGDIYLEIGVDKGKSLSVAKMVAQREVEVCGIDLRPDPRVLGTTFIQGDSRKIAKLWLPEINVLFIDGDHTYDGCKADIDGWYPHMAKKGVMLFHDCDASSPGVVQAVQEFVAEYKLTDVYYDPNPQCSMARIRL